MMTACSNVFRSPAGGRFMLMTQQGPSSQVKLIELGRTSSMHACEKKTMQSQSERLRSERPPKKQQNRRAVASSPDFFAIVLIVGFPSRGRQLQRDRKRARIFSPCGCRIYV